MPNPMPLPHNAENWWDEIDRVVGTGCERYTYLHNSRVILQLEITSEALCPRCGAGGREPPLKRYGRKCDGCKKRLDAKDATDRIANVRCWVEDDNLNAEQARRLSVFIAKLLAGQKLAEAVAIQFENGICEINIRDALRAALKDWASKFGGRESRLPAIPEPKLQRRTKFVRRILSRRV